MIMTKKLRYFCTLLLMAVASVAWAEDVVFYTLDTTDSSTKGKNSNYASSGDVTVDGITWCAEANNNLNPWRIGGKSLTAANRAVYTKTAMEAAISKLELTLSGGSGVTLNSLKLTVASNADFSTVLDEVTLSDVKLDGTVNTVTPTPGKTWAKNAYYKFTFNVTIKDSSNKYIGFNKVQFFKEQEAGEKIDPTVTIGAETIEIGGMTTVTSNGPTFSIDVEDDEVVTVNSDLDIIGVGAGSTTITVSWDGNEQFNEGSVEFTITVIDPNVKGGANNPYTVAEAIEYINTLEANTLSPTDVYVKGVVSQIDSYVGDRYITYWISDDGTTDNQMEVFKGLGLDGAFFSAKTDLTVGDKVTVCGKVKLYKNNSGTTIIPEFDTGSIIVSLEENTDPYISAPDVVELAYDATEGEIEVSIENAAVAILGGSVEEGCDWITDLNTSVSPVTFKTTVNESSDPREATITFTGGGASKVVTIIQAGAPVVYTTISDMFDAATEFGNKATDVLVKFGGWVVTGASSNNVFVSDGTHGFIIYAKDHGFKVDDVLTSEEPISCKLQLYNGSAEITALTASTTGLTITTNEGGDTYAIVSMADLSGVNTGALISYNELTCSKDGNNVLLTDGTTTLKVFTTLYSDALSKFEDGKMYSVQGIYQQFNNNQGETKEILPRYASDIEVVELPTLFFDVEIGESGYATLYYSDVNLAIPDGVTVSYVSDLSGKQLVTKPITEVIPAGTAVILQGEKNTTYEFDVTDAEATAITGNMLFGTDENQSVYVDGDCYYYKLVEEDGVVGFWWGAEDGGPFQNTAHKAYLKVEKSYFESSSPAKVFYLFGGDGGVSTGINNVEKIAEGAAIYNLNGVRVNKMQKGVYVVNGKKVVIK